MCRALPIATAFCQAAIMHAPAVEVDVPAVSGCGEAAGRPRTDSFADIAHEFAYPIYDA
jgi:hypothetical protein